MAKAEEFLKNTRFIELVEKESDYDRLRNVLINFPTDLLSSLSKLVCEKAELTD